jgi:hypothetical protein
MIPTPFGHAYLQDATYTLSGGGTLEADAAPEPSTYALMLGGMGLLLLLFKAGENEAGPSRGTGVFLRRACLPVGYAGADQVSICV